MKEQFHPKGDFSCKRKVSKIFHGKVFSTSGNSSDQIAASNTRKSHYDYSNLGKLRVAILILDLQIEKNKVVVQ